MKNCKLLLVSIALFSACTTLASCSAEEKTPDVCVLKQELAPYKQLKATASVYENNQYGVNVTLTNEGDQYVPVYSFYKEYCSTGGVSLSSIYYGTKCPFEHRYVAPGETFTIVSEGISVSQESLTNQINEKGLINTCYYTSEYTKVTFSDFKIRVLSREEEKEKKLYNRVQLFYKKKGSFTDGDNYHLLVNFNYDGQQYTVMSTDPNYEINSFGFDLESPYWRNLEGWEDENGYYKDYVFDENKFSVNWVKCYTAWFRSKQPGKCKDTWRRYEDKTAKFVKNLLVGLAITTIVVGSITALVIVARKKRKEEMNK